MAPHFLSSDLQQLAQGSFEHVIARLHCALNHWFLNEGGSALLSESNESGEPGAPVDFQSIATFPDHILAMTSNGRIVRFTFSEDEKGVRVSGHEFLEVPSFSEEDQDSVLQAEVRETLGDLLAGVPQAEQSTQRLVSRVVGFDGNFN